MQVTKLIIEVGNVTHKRLISALSDESIKDF